MKILSAELVTSAAAGGTASGVPRGALLQVAVAGRSNVGKSTLINALCRRQIARTSAAPGKTRLANIYRLTVEGGPRRGSGPGGAGRWSLYLVDLPGYGYARGGRNAVDELKAVAEAYFRESAVIGTAPDHRLHSDVASTEHRAPSSEHRMSVLLIDSRHPGLESDLQAYRWLAALGAAPLIVATKVDKLSRAERTRNLRDIERIFGQPALPVSAERGEGMDELWKTIASKGRAASRAAAE